MTRRFRTRAPSALTRGATGSARAIANLWFASPLHRLLLGGSHPLKLLGSIDPERPQPASSAAAEDDAAASLLGGQYRTCGRDFGFETDNFWALTGTLPVSALPALHGFEWLADLASIAGDDEKAEARRLAEQATQSWIEAYAHWDPVAWQPDVTGKRLMAWIAHSNLVLSSGDMVYRSAVLDSMARQTRHLRQALITARPGPGRVSAAAGLVMASILLPGLEGKRKPGLKALRRALQQNVLADGSPLTRNPADAERVISELVTLKACFAAVTLAPPDWLQSALDRALPAMLALDHGDHRRAQFNGAFARLGAPDSALAEAADAHGRAPVSLPHGGYERVKRWRTCIIVDVGQPPPGPLSCGHHAAPLAIEFSDGKDRIVVNMGGSNTTPGQADGLAALCRTTAAHSTLVMGDTNSAEIRSDGQIGKGPVSTDVEREENDEGVWLTASHDGYANKWGVRHKRTLYLSAAGTDFRGEDVLQPEPGRQPSRKRQETSVDIRFHLHPAVSASMTRDGHAVILRLPHGHGWLFRGETEDGGRATIEDSLYVPTPETPVKTSQIVLSSPWRRSTSGIRFNWSFHRMDSKD